MSPLFSRLTERRIWIALVALILLGAALWLAGVIPPGLFVGLVIGVGLVGIWRALDRPSDDSRSSVMDGS